MLRTDGSHAGDVELNGTDENKTSRSVSKTKRLSKTTHDMLTEIFKKVGSKENTKEGLQDLYNFKKKYPEADLEPFLKKSSHFFQNYIERGLKAIENEEREKAQNPGDGNVQMSQGLVDRSLSSEHMMEKAKAKQGADRPGDSPAESTDVEHYFEKLRAIRAQWGLDSVDKSADMDQKIEDSDRIDTKQDQDTVRNFDGFPGDEEPEEVPKPDPPKAPATDVSQLKARLERIKQMANS